MEHLYWRAMALNVSPPRTVCVRAAAVRALELAEREALELLEARPETCSLWPGRITLALPRPFIERSAASDSP